MTIIGMFSLVFFLTSLKTPTSNSRSAAPSPQTQVSTVHQNIQEQTGTETASQTDTNSTLLPPSPITFPVQELTLSEEDRNYIWRTEHHGNILRDFGFSTLSAALLKNSKSEFKKQLSNKFQGKLPTTPKHTTLSQPGMKIDRTLAVGEQFDTKGAEEFTEWIFGLRHMFTSELNVRWHVITLSPEKQKDFEGAWQGTGKLHLWGEHSEGQPSDLLIYFSMNIDKLEKEHLQNNGWLEECRIDEILQGQSREYLFREVAEERGLQIDRLHDNWKCGKRSDMVLNSGGVYLSDYNRDGMTDLLITDVASEFNLELYQGLPNGRFKNVTLEMGLKKPGLKDVLLAAFVDIDGDGWEDLIHGWKNYRSGCRIYRNIEGKRFEEITKQSNFPYLVTAAEGFNPPAGLAIADYDRDGKVDIYVSRSAGSSAQMGSWIDGKTGVESNNQLLRNLGNWQFEDVTTRTGTDGDERSTFSSVWMHANQDLWPDLYVIDEFGDGLLYLNEQGVTFKPVSLVDHPTDFGSMGVTCGDIDNDGFIDLYVNSMYSKAGKRVIGNIPEGAYTDDIMQKLMRMVDGSELHRGTGNLQFERVGQQNHVDAVGWGWGAGLFDLDNDGFLDLYATAGFISLDRTKPDG